jgi:NDP-sugar pyrophosphorylase family protein
LIGVILAAGRGKRLGELTLKQPKPMVPVGGKPAITYVIDGMHKAGVDNIIVVRKYLGDILRDYLNEEYPGVKCVYQGDTYGTASALMATRSHIPLREELMVSFGDIIAVPDDIYSEVRAQFMVRKSSAVLAVNWTENPESCGVIEIKPTGEVAKIHEKVSNPPSNLNNTGIFCFKYNIFQFLRYVVPDSNGEFNLVDAINTACDYTSVHAVEYKGELFDIGSPEKLAEANERVGAMECPKKVLKTLMKGQ